MNTEPQRQFDLEERLLDYAADVVRLTESLGESRAQRYVGGQLLRSGTSPLAHHGEAQSAESDADFVHKLKIGLKELRESHRWLKLIVRVPLVEDLSTLDALLDETDQLERIFNASVNTVKQRIKNRR